MALKDILVPDIGDADSVEVIEVCVNSGDTIAVEDSIIVLESDKATIEVPAPAAGEVAEVKIKVGDKVSEGDLILVVNSADAAEEKTAEPEPVKESVPEQQTLEVEPPAPAAEPAGTVQDITVKVPDIGDADAVEIIEIEIAVGDSIEIDQTARCNPFAGRKGECGWRANRRFGQVARSTAT